jgi:hypothetical protein
MEIRRVKKVIKEPSINWRRYYQSNKRKRRIIILLYTLNRVEKIIATSVKDEFDNYHRNCLSSLTTPIKITVLISSWLLNARWRWTSINKKVDSPKQKHWNMPCCIMETERLSIRLEKYRRKRRKSLFRDIRLIIMLEKFHCAYWSISVILRIYKRESLLSDQSSIKNMQIIVLLPS